MLPGAVCLDTCTYSGGPAGGWASNGVCSDGGPGAEGSDCALGTDCTDCGPRVMPPPSPPSPPAPPMLPGGSQCLDTCNWASDGVCEDGGPGAEWSDCALGTDCTDCGPRVMPPPSPTSPPRPPMLPGAVCLDTC